jgi:hypothetical protein
MFLPRIALVVHEATRPRTRTGSMRHPVTGRASSDLETGRSRR